MSRSAARRKQVEIPPAAHTDSRGRGGFQEQPNRLGQIVKVDVAWAELANYFLMNQVIDGAWDGAPRKRAVSHGRVLGRHPRRGPLGVPLAIW
jgi:hypothetical protein